MSNGMIDRGVAVALIAIGAIVAFIASGFPGDAGVFPIAMAFLLGLSCVVLLIRPNGRGEKRETDRPALDGRRFCLWVGLAVLFFLIVWQVDFYLGIFVFLVLSYLAFSNARLLVKLSLAALFSVVLYIGFDLLLGVPVPSRIDAVIGSMR